MFTIKNIRNKEYYILTSEEFRDKIIRETGCEFENGYVTEERTGLRPESLNIFIKELSKKSFVIQKHIFLVTALRRVNNDKNSRYMILIDGNEYDSRLPSLVHDYVPIYSVTIKGSVNEEGKLSSLSKWFRATMGRAFSFIDIDYLLINRYGNKVALIEEKIGKSGVSSIGYGQLISYEELLKDVLKDPRFLLFIFNSTPNASLNTVVEYYLCDKDSFEENGLRNFTIERKSLKDLLQVISERMS